MTNPLRTEVKASFYPFAEAAGFERLKSRHPHFTEFRRASIDRSDVFDIQWDKYARPYFVINFGQCSRGSENQYTKPCRLQRKRSGFLSSWFNTRRPLAVVLTTGRLTYTPSEVVAQVMSCFPEMERWWATKEQGPHVYAPLLANNSFKPNSLRESA